MKEKLSELESQVKQLTMKTGGETETDSAGLHSRSLHESSDLYTEKVGSEEHIS